MRSRPVFYIIGFILLAINLILFNKAYRALTNYSEISNSYRTDHSNYQTLSRQINNAAVINPELLTASHSVRVDSLFLTDSLAIVRQLSLLNLSALDSISSQIADDLDKLIKPELSWLLNSNVPDSILNNKAAEHIASFVSIDSLIKKGIQRTNFLMEYVKAKLNDKIKEVRILIIFFVLLSGFFGYTRRLVFLSKKQKQSKKQQSLRPSSTALPTPWCPLTINGDILF